MAKTIKFNLICDGNPVRTIEDLQNNFSIEDVLEYYSNSLLHRWLRVRGYNKELEAVSAITSKEPMEIIKELIRIFDVVVDEKQTEESVYMLQYLDERKELCAIYEQENYKATHIIEDYESGYRQLVDGILENPEDVAKIKANIAEITSNYAWLLKLNHRDLFYILKEQSMLAVMCLLMNEKSRNYYLPVETAHEEGATTTNTDTKCDKSMKNNDPRSILIEGLRTYNSSVEKNSKDRAVTFDTDTNRDKREMYDNICAMIKTVGFVIALGKENLKTYAGVTDGYWKDLESKDKRYMIISMDAGDYVRSAGLQGGDLGYADVLNKFVILDGIDYKSNSDTHKLIYMEV